MAERAVQSESAQSVPTPPRTAVAPVAAVLDAQVLRPQPAAAAAAAGSALQLQLSALSGSECSWLARLGAVHCAILLIIDLAILK